MAESRKRVAAQELTLQDKVVYINRVAKVVKGGRRFSFSALVVVGDGQGHVGAAMGKAREVPEAIRKGTAKAKKNLLAVPLKGRTITHQVTASLGAARVLIKPAPPGTGIIAGGGVRAVMEMAGIQDVVAKSLGSSNANSVVHCTLKALQELRDPALALAQRKGHALAAGARKPSQAAPAATGAS